MIVSVSAGSAKAASSLRVRVSLAMILSEQFEDFAFPLRVGVLGDHREAFAFAKEEGVPLAVANRVFGKDAVKPIIEELNEVLVG